MATITVVETFTRLQMTGRANPEGNETIAANTIFNRMLAKGVPIIGILGVLAVEWGKLTIEYEDGLDGDEWTYTWTGEPMPKEFIDKLKIPGNRLRLTNPLAQQIAEAEEL